MRSLPHAAFLLSIALLFATACDDDAGGAPAATPSAPAASGVEHLAPADGVPVVMAVRHVCRLAGDSPSAIDAQITGVDGSQSVVAGGVQYWFFGDTVRADPGGRAVIPASVATTSDGDPADCLDLRFKTQGGIAAPMFPRLDETTAWPDGVLALDDGSILFFMVKAIRTSPFAWYVESIGLGRIPPGSTDGQRLVERIWDENSGFGARVAGARSPVRLGDDVIVYIRTEDDRNYVAKAPLDRIGEAAAYTYWDGSAWRPNPADAEPMWVARKTDVPSDNGVQVTFDERSGKWVAVYNGEMSRVEARVAVEPWGPWSEPVVWFDCRPLVQERYPYCYSGEMHRHLARDDGAVQYMTVSSSLPYDVSLLELHVATPIREWRDAEGLVRYAAEAPDDGWQQGDVAFYASLLPAPGLVPVCEVQPGERYQYAQCVADDGATPAFYAYPSPDGGAVTLVAVAPVGSDDDGRLVMQPGDDPDALFYVPCAGAPSSSSCRG